MVYLIAILSLLFSIFAVVYYKNIYNFMFLFNAYIFISSFVNCFNPYGVTDITFQSGFIIIVGITTMFIATLLFDYHWRYSIYKNKNNHVRIKTLFNKKFFYCLYVITLVYLVIKAIMVIQMLSSGYTMSYIRMSYNYLELGTTTPIEVMLRMYFIEPLVTLSYCMLPVFLYKYRKKFMLIKIMLISTIGLNVLVYGARIAIINLIFIIIIYIFIVNKHERLNLVNIIKKYIKIILVSILGVLILSMMRISDVLSIKREIYINFFAWIPTFSKYLEISNITYSFGLILIMGIIRFPMTFLSTLFNFEYPQIYDIASNIGVFLQDSVHITNDIQMNAHGSIFYYLFIDSGYITLIIGFIFLSYLYLKTYLEMEKYYTEYTIIKYLLIVLSIFFIKTRYQFYLPQYCFTFIYLKLLVKNRRVCDGR